MSERHDTQICQCHFSDNNQKKKDLLLGACFCFLPLFIEIEIVIDATGIHKAGLRVDENTYTSICVLSYFFLSRKGSLLERKCIA